MDYIGEIKELEKDVCDSDKKYRQITIDLLQNFIQDYEYEDSFENELDEEYFIGSKLREANNVIEIIDLNNFPNDAAVFTEMRGILTDWLYDLKKNMDAVD